MLWAQYLINLINVLYSIICIFLFSRICGISSTCQVSEIPNPKPTIKRFTKNHRLFMHNETIIL